MKRDRELTRLFRQELPVDVQGKKRVLEAVEKSIRIKRPVFIPTWQQIFCTQLTLFSRGYWCFQAFWLLLGASAVLWLGDLTVYGLNSPFLRHRFRAAWWNRAVFPM